MSFFSIRVFLTDIDNTQDSSSICRWTGNEDFQYGIFRFWEKYGREIIFSTLDGAGNYWKNNEKSGFEITKNGISKFGE